MITACNMVLTGQYIANTTTQLVIIFRLWFQIATFNAGTYMDTSYLEAAGHVISCNSYSLFNITPQSDLGSQSKAKRR